MRLIRKCHGKRQDHAPACESLECRRLLAAEVLSVVPGGAATGNRASTVIPGLGAGPSGAVVSDDGRYVVFESDATDLVPGLSTGGMPDGTHNVYVRDRATGTTE